jgi:hypothetical protein
VTGIFLDFPELGGKWLELVTEVAPKVSRVAVLWDPATGRVPLKGAEAAAPSLRLKLEVLEARGPSEFEAAFNAAIRARAGAMVILSSPVFNTYRRQLVDLAAKHRLPVIMPFPFFADDGGLIAYGTDLIELYRQGGVMVGKILKGASPKDPSHRAAQPLRAGREHENREGPRHHYPQIGPDSGGPGDRIIDNRNFRAALLECLLSLRVTRRIMWQKPEASRGRGCRFLTRTVDARSKRA